MLDVSHLTISNIYQYNFNLICIKYRIFCICDKFFHLFNQTCSLKSIRQKALPKKQSNNRSVDDGQTPSLSPSIAYPQRLCIVTLSPRFIGAKGLGWGVPRFVPQSPILRSDSMTSVTFSLLKQRPCLHRKLIDTSSPKR